MGKSTRIGYDSGLFHVICRGNNKQNLFKDEKDYLRYLSTLQRFKKKYPFNLYAYCLMPNHVHLLVEIKDASLSKMMQSINLSFFWWHKKKYDYSGHLWQGRFKSLPIGKEGYLFECSRYIELNPVRASFAADPSHYKWSSYRAYAFGEENKLIDTHLISELISEKQEEQQAKYREYVLGDTALNLC